MSAISTKIYAKDSSGTLRELQPETTISNVSGLQTALDGKVDTVSGKGLSTNDYTTTEKNKLAGIANNANNYVHPTTSGNKHIPSGGSSGKILGWSADGTAAWIDEPSKGTVTSVKVGSTSYSPSSGIVSLPEYVTFGTKGVFTKVMSSLVIRDGSYMIKNNIFYVANIFFTTISNVSANTETTLATASSLPTYEVKAVATVYKNDNSSILTDSAILKIKEDGTVTITSPVAIGSGTNSGRINNIRLIDLSA